MHCSGTQNGVRVQEEEVPLMVRSSSSGLHSHSLRLAKQDSITSLQTKLRQQFRHSTCLLLPSTADPCFCCCLCLLPLLRCLLFTAAPLLSPVCLLWLSDLPAAAAFSLTCSGAAFCVCPSVQDGVYTQPDCCFLVKSKPCVLHKPVPLYCCIETHQNPTGLSCLSLSMSD